MSVEGYKTLPLTAHSGHLLVETPQVREISGHTGRFVADFGPFNLHFTEQQWNDLDSAVRAGIAAARAKASA